jgi:hypothetical protein
LGLALIVSALTWTFRDTDVRSVGALLGTLGAAGVQTCRAELATSLPAMALRKWLLLTTQAIYATAFAILAFPVLSRIS